MFTSLRYRARIWVMVWQNRLFIYGLPAGRGDVAFVAMLALPVIVLVSIVSFAYTDGMQGNEERRRAANDAAREREAELRCLAENVYFEARGEPMAGQYAVAEVTLNRVVSPHFPDTICDVVHEARWDPLRKRRVAAFSWTELEIRHQPGGVAWQQAMQAASAVYNEVHTPVVPEALFYHATYVDPSWAKTKKRVATVGNHIFYR